MSAGTDPLANRVSPKPAGADRRGKLDKKHDRIIPRSIRSREKPDLPQATGCSTISVMTTNPYAYYDDEPLPLSSRPLSVSADGEEEPDREPRCPLKLKGQFVSMFKLAIRTYRIDVTGHLLECRLPNGDFLQLSREEAREQVRVKGMMIDIDVSQYKTYHFRCYRGHDLALARLHVWLQPPIADAEQSYHAVAEQIKSNILSPWFCILTLVFLLWLIFSVIGDYHKANQFPVFGIEFLICCVMIPIRILSAILFFAFLGQRLSGKVNGRLLRAAATLPLVFPIYFYIMIFVPALRIVPWPFHFPFFEFYFPCVLFGIFLRYRRADKQLQRENGLLS